MTLLEFLRHAAEELDEIETAEEDGAVTWRRAGRPFATASAAGAEFDLDPVVARAAARTPDVSPSTRGPGWILFRPVTLDGHARDRAEAWFGSAWRRAQRP